MADLSGPDPTEWRLADEQLDEIERQARASNELLALGMLAVYRRALAEVSRLRKQNERQGEALLRVSSFGAALIAREYEPGSVTVRELITQVRAALASQESGEPVERIPSHRSDELPRYIQIDRLNFRVDAETLTGRELRYLPTPPIHDEEP